MRTPIVYYTILLAVVGIAPGKEPQPSKPGKAESSKTRVVDLGSGVKMELVLIPRGSFVMGDDQSELDDAKPAHRVTITKPFYIGKCEVTQEQWQVVMDGNPSEFKGPKNPVEQVSWDDCQVFLKRLNALAAGQGGKFVLPTEAQWEYACRAGSTTKFSFGNDDQRLNEYAWHEYNAGHKTHPVGAKRPNAWGLYDMHGNVWEWCQDRYAGDYYANSPEEDPGGGTGGSARVYRGGSWGDLAEGFRSAGRDFQLPDYRSGHLGFRVAQVVAQ